MVSVNVPLRVLFWVAMVIVDEPEPVTDGGLKLALEWLGRPVTLNATFPLKPPEGVTVTV